MNKKQSKIIAELDEINYFIVRNDGVILRNEIGDYRIEAVKNIEGNIIELNRINNKNICLKYNYSFSFVLISDYKRENPTFKF